jgi:hypothetical protein
MIMQSQYDTQALLTIREACTPYGILASAERQDNYARVWSRDAAMAGIAGLLWGDPHIIHAWGASIQVLAAAQTPYGQIPSNIAVHDSGIKASYGTLAGRVDATTWWIISAALFAAETPHAADDLLPKIEKALALLSIWELNGRGLMYTPLGGNWADEYVYSGYLLYDQLLRLWALRAAGRVFDRPAWRAEANTLQARLEANYTKTNLESDRYHPKAYAKTTFPDGYWCCGLGPQGYDTRWDMAANALALLLGVNTHVSSMANYLNDLAVQIGHWMLPVFWPVIHPSDAAWALLEDNHLYEFKNQPFCFHNGGCWPIFLGWLGLGLAVQGDTKTPKLLQNALHQAFDVEMPAGSMHEYWRTDTLEAGGVPHLCYTAAGTLLLSVANSTLPNHLSTAQIITS